MTTETSNLSELPPPHICKTGWPWTEGSHLLPSLMPDGKPWPKISIVTPSYNQGQFLEETIRSVLLQNYPNLEYIIMDGGSTDNSVEIIKKYAPWLTYWVSEKDKGQADAIYRGFEMATGDIIAWINSDDYYLPAAFNNVGSIFSHQQDAELVVGGHYYVDEYDTLLKKYPLFCQDFDSLVLWIQQIAQMSAFWRRSVFFEVGGFDRNLRFSFDYDLFLRLIKRKNLVPCEQFLSVLRGHNLSKTNTIWDTYGWPEVQQLQKIHATKMYSSKERNMIVWRSIMMFSLNILRCTDNLFIDYKSYFKEIINFLKSFIKYMVAKFYKYIN